MITREAEAKMRGGQGVKNAGGVQIVNSFGVAFLVAVGHELLDQFELAFFGELRDFGEAAAI